MNPLKMYSKNHLLSLLFLGLSQVVFSQIKEEQLILQHKREPEVKKIEKIKTSVELPKPLAEGGQKPGDTATIRYTITDVPPVSDFKTTALRGEDVAPDFHQDFQKNYVRIGMGNYGRVLADGHAEKALPNNMEVGADAHFLSTTGLGKVYAWDSKQNSADLAAYLNSYGNKGKFNITLDYGLNDYNYYGIYALSPPADTDLRQKTDRFQANGFYDFYDNPVLKDIVVKSSFLTDHFGSKENQAGITLDLARHGLALPQLPGVAVDADLGISPQTLSTDFAFLDKHSNVNFTLGLTPKLTFKKGNSSLSVGVGFEYESQKYQDNSLPQVTSDRVFWFPEVALLVAPTEAYKFYAGVDGGLKVNSYAGLLEENPYLAPDLLLKPTVTKYHLYFGMKGDVGQNLKYDAGAGFSKLEDAVFFSGRPLYDLTNTLHRSAYNFANTFSTVYDSGTLSEIKANVQYFFSGTLSVDGGFKYQKYTLDNLADAYYKPLFSGTVGAKYTLMKDKLQLGLKGIFVGNRKGNAYAVTTGSPYFSFQSIDNVKVGGYADLNISAEYKIHKNFSIFVLGNNILNTNYQTYNGYRTLGAQVLGGVRISF